MLSGVFEKRRGDLLGLLAVLLVTIALALLFQGRHLDRSFITYRYAHNLAAGQSFGFNPGEPLLLEAVAPLYAGLLALGSRVMADLPRLSNLLGSAAIGLGALAVYDLTRPAGALPAALAAGLYAAQPVLWLWLGLEAPLWVALCLAGIALHRRGRAPGVAIVLALAALMRPEALVLAALLAADAVLEGRRFDLLALGVYTAILAGGLLWLRETGVPGALPGIPDTAELFAGGVAGGLGALARSLLALSPLWVVAGLLAAAGAVWIVRSRSRAAHGPALVAVWAALHLAALLVLGVGVHAWHFAPLLTATGLLAALGVGWLRPARRAKPQPETPRRRFTRVSSSASRNVSPLPGVLGLAGAVLLAGAAAHSAAVMVLSRAGAAWQALGPEPAEPADAQAAHWLAENTPADATVGAQRIGLLGYASERRIVDAQGRFQPGIAAAAARGDSTWWLAEYAPDYVVLPQEALDALNGDEWLQAAYSEQASAAETGGVAILARTAEVSPLVQHGGEAEFPAGLQLNGLAADFALEPLDQDRTGRLRLAWQLDAPLEGERHVAIRIQSREGAIAALNGSTLDFSAVPPGEPFTTFHTASIAPNLQPGVYDVAVGVGADPAELAWRTVAQGVVPGESAFVGAVAGSQAQFGDITLQGYRLSRTKDGAELVLLWEAVRAPQADYSVFVQVRDAQGRVMIYRETEPRGGTYPSSAWAEGERVADTYAIDSASLPAGVYQVYAGLIDPDGKRLLAVDGRSEVLVGQLNTAP